MLARPCGYAYLSLSFAVAITLAVCGANVESALADLTHRSREDDEDRRQRLRANFLWYIFLIFFFTFPVTLLWSSTVLLHPPFLPKLVHQKITNAKDFLTAKHGHWFTMAAFVWPGLHATTTFLCVFIISDFSRLPIPILVLGFAPLGAFFLYGLCICCTGRWNKYTQREDLVRENNEAWDRVLAARDRWGIQDMHK